MNSSVHGEGLQSNGHWPGISPNCARNRKTIIVKGCVTVYRVDKKKDVSSLHGGGGGGGVKITDIAILAPIFYISFSDGEGVCHVSFKL